MNKLSKNNKGSIALISILIISAMLVLIVLGISEVNISNNLSYTNTTADQKTYNFAESCFEDTVKRIEKDALFAGATTEFAQEEITCTSIVSGQDPYTIRVELIYGNYTQYFEGEISLTNVGQVNNAKLLNWKEIE